MARHSSLIQERRAVYWSIRVFSRNRKKVRDAWNEAYGGSGNAHKVAVLEEGDEIQSYLHQST